MNSTPLQLKLPKFQTARVWLNGLPAAVLFKGHHTITKTVEAGQIGQCVVHAAAIEWLVPLGPRSAYGLLGGRLFSDGQTPFQIEVVTSICDAPKYAESLASKVSDDPRIGLPAEYGQSVLEAASDAFGRLKHPASGRVVLDHAAHGLVGSSPVMFARLAVALVELLSAEKIPDQRSLEQILVWK